MKGFLGIIALIVFTILLFKLIDTKTPVYFDEAINIEVKENETNLELTKELNNMNARWKYEYEIKDEGLYITTYKVYNSISQEAGPVLNVHINKGSNDFDEIYINSEDGNKIVWRESK